MLKIDDATANKTLQDKLKSFKVNMVSSGFYDYKFNDKVYRMKNTIIRPSSNYGSNTGKNEDYINIEKASPLFSPYTNWEIQLSKISSGKLNDDFKDLKPYLNSLVKPELHIIGSASYFDRNTGGKGVDGRPKLYTDIKVSEYYEEFKIDQNDVVQWC